MVIGKETKVHERFIGFINCHDRIYGKNEGPEGIDQSNLEPKLTGKLLGDTVVNILKEMALDLNNCIGIGTVGCAVMTSVMQGAVQQI